MRTPALPSAEDLTDEQIRGAACVWCGGRLTNATAVSLGEMPLDVGHRADWFPRSCPNCPTETS